MTSPRHKEEDCSSEGFRNETGAFAFFDFAAPPFGTTSCKDPVVSKCERARYESFLGVEASNEAFGGETGVGQIGKEHPLWGPIWGGADFGASMGVQHAAAAKRHFGGSFFVFAEETRGGRWGLGQTE